MKRFQVKVCGMTRPVDAELAVKLGADLIGLIFYSGSPRDLTMKRAKEITGVLPPTVDRVGVFVDADLNQILKTADKLRLDYVQLHGKVSASTIKSIGQQKIKVIQAYSIKSKSDWTSLSNSKADLILVDNSTANLPGGTGQQFDWSLKPDRRIDNLLLAGGINADNVAKGVRAFQPLIVDVNSGVERSPGLKSPTKLKQFFAVCDRIRYGK